MGIIPRVPEAIRRSWDGGALMSKRSDSTLDVPCTSCGSAPGEVCLASDGIIEAPHVARRALRNVADLSHPAWEAFAAWIRGAEGRTEIMKCAHLGIFGSSQLWSAFRAGYATMRSDHDDAVEHSVHAEADAQLNRYRMAIADAAIALDSARDDHTAANIRYEGIRDRGGPSDEAWRRVKALRGVVSRLESALQVAINVATTEIDQPGAGRIAQMIAALPEVSPPDGYEERVLAALGLTKSTT